MDVNCDKNSINQKVTKSKMFKYQTFLWIFQKGVKVMDTCNKKFGGGRLTVKAHVSNKVKEPYEVKVWKVQTSYMEKHYIKTMN